MTDEHEELHQQLIMRRMQRSARPANFQTMAHNVLLVIASTCLLISLAAWLVSYVGIDLADRDGLGYVSLSGGAFIAQRAEFSGELQQPSGAEWLGFRYVNFGSGDYFLRVPIWMMVVGWGAISTLPLFPFFAAERHGTKNKHV